ncbi:dihydrolipoyl dehydrogenase [Companilactobacillus sp. FL22-1]|uniref:dihydrolipoyl dehydrogenase n=1 Tax=Companilactobacillus sp. FL22-1 TaxID=3373892 RepID=UPI0037553FD1
MADPYDLVVIGGGVGGYSGAIRASQLGLKVALVEADLLGGTCLNRGCIPTKAYLKSAEVFREVKQADNFGITNSGEFGVDFSSIKRRKDQIVEKLRSGVAFLIKKNQIDYFAGQASVLGTSIFTPKAGSVMIKPNNGDDEVILTPKNVLIATGSRPSSLSNLEIDGERILSSNDVLELNELPDSIVIIGGGVIGVEWASLLTDLGVKVELVEFQDQLIASESSQAAKILQAELTKRGVKVDLSTSVEEINLDGENLKIVAKTEDQFFDVTAQKVLVAVGRRPNVENIGLEAAGIEFDQQGIIVNDYYQTNLDNIYAIGDVINTLQLAHVAAKEAELAVEHIAGQVIEKLDYQNVPRGIYTYPEIASVGRTDGTTISTQEALQGRFDWQANGKAMIEKFDVGYVEAFGDKMTEDFIGLTIVGGHATDMISEASLALYLNATPEEIGQTIHPHPTQSEAIMEANNDIFGRAINK